MNQCNVDVGDGSGGGGGRPRTGGRGGWFAPEPQSAGGVKRKKTTLKGSVTHTQNTKRKESSGDSYNSGTRGDLRLVYRIRFTYLTQ